MLGVFWRSIRDKKWTIFAFYLSGILFAWIYAAMNASVQATQAQVADFVKNLPPALNKAFGMDPSTFNTFEGYVGSKQFSLVWPILVVALMGGLAASYIAGEIEKGTIDLALAQPISRTKIFLARIGSGVVALIFYIVFSVLAFIPMASLYGIQSTGESFGLLALVGFIFGLAIYGISMFFSSLVSDKGRAAFISAGLFLIMYVVYLFALLNDKYDKLKLLSLFYYFDYVSILLHKTVTSGAWLVYLATFLVFSIAGTFWFTKRDIAT